MEENKTVQTDTPVVEKKSAPVVPATTQTTENGEKKPKPKRPMNKRKKTVVPKMEDKSGDGWITALRKAHVINERIHKDRLNPHNKLNLNSTQKIRITPLGGLGEGAYSLGGFQLGASPIGTETGIGKILSDRAAAMNLKFRIDWKIAFGLEIDDMGIH